MQAAARKSPRFFVYLAFATVLLTVGLIVFGAIVRVTDSGLGCGNEWPLCHGSIIPPLDNITAWIEWTHRLFAVLIGLFGIVMLVTAIRTYRKRDWLVFNATVVAAVLYAVQSSLGGIVVMFDLPPTFVTLHLGTAMLLLAALLVAALAAVYNPPASYERDNFTLLAYITAALSFVIILTGALVRGSGATLACIDWPLCNGSALPFNQGPLQTIHWLHRLAVVGLGVSLLILVWQVWSARSSTLVRRLALAAGIAYLLQAGVGALFVLTSAAPEWGAVHVGVAALTWALLVALSTVDTMNTSKVRAGTGWKIQSDAVAG
ncbi:MAG: COX15/CtaA family protein [Anaerolineae bacterium]|nr:COX15/CtaA family protein [Anaerolineae bacterium]